MGSARSNWKHWLLAGSAVLGCVAAAPSPAEYGPHPQLTAPQTSLMPVVKTAKPVGWKSGEAPTAAPGLAVTAFAGALDHPRWLTVLPNGDVLVAESNKPSVPSTGIKDFIAKKIMKGAGAGTPSANRITLLRDADHDGVAETKTVFLSGLNSPFGMALVGHDLYVANTDAVMKFPYQDGATQITQPGVKVADLPAFPIDHHWTKNILASRDGKTLYATVGSNSNIGENGLDKEEGRAAIWQIDLASGKMRAFATGLRNPNGMAWEPTTNVLWTVVNERDELGDELVPDYMTSVRDGGFYGWPYSYYGAKIDARVKPQKPDLVAKAVAPDYALGAHTASLGLVFSQGMALPAKYRGGAFVGQHGSWNRSAFSGYKVIFVPFADGRPSGMPEDVLTGFLDGKDNARGRPVGVAVDGAGALLVADDVGNAVWRVTAAP